MRFTGFINYSYKIILALSGLGSRSNKSNISCFCIASSPSKNFLGKKHWVLLSLFVWFPIEETIVLNWPTVLKLRFSRCFLDQLNFPWPISPNHVENFPSVLFWVMYLLYRPHRSHLSWQALIDLTKVTNSSKSPSNDARPTLESHTFLIGTKIFSPIFLPSRFCDMKVININNNLRLGWTNSN